MSAVGRSVRVFISSTFRDMHAERDLLIKKIFPQLRKLCESRAVTWTEVDLRWGITDEQKAEGKVLPLCLEEIRRCRPYFIGLLGERYGWVPTSIPTELMEQQPWLKEHLEKSVTELEILHGALNNPAMAKRALFYFRNRAYAVAVPLEKQEEFTETGPDAERLQRKLTDLKSRVRTAADQNRLKYPPREDYADPEALGELVLADLTRIIDELYPADQIPDPLDQEADRHEQHARSRRELYIARPGDYRLLDEHVAGDGPPLVLVGESGCGKTALLANWVDRWRQAHPDALVLQHYIGSTPDSADWMRLVTRVLGELKREFQLPDEAPSQPDELRSALDDWLMKTAGGRRIVLVLDGLNQLEDRDNAQSLGWLPRMFPRNVRVLASALPSKALDAARQRNWPTQKVDLLRPEERLRLVTEYLQRGGRTADAGLLSAIQRQPQTLNPLYLRAFLDEIRVFGRFEELPEEVGKYLSAADPKALYRLILRRWLRDYPEARVGEALCLIWTARRGLSEAELMDLLGQDGNPLPRQRWTPFYLVAEKSLVLRAGLINFAHDYLSMAVREELLAEDVDQAVAHLRLADYFGGQPEMTSRKAEEWPWQLQAAQAWERLETALTDIELFLTLANDKTRWELTGYWLPLLARGRDLGRCYTTAFARCKQAVPDSESISYLANEIGKFLYDNGCYSAAELLYREALELRRQCLPAEHPDSATSLNNLAGLLQAQGKLAEAEPLLREAMEINRRSLPGGHPHIATDLNNLASLLRHQGKLAEAEPLFHESLELRRQAFPAGHPDIAISLNNLALLLKAQGRLSEAEPLFHESLELRRRALPAGHPDIAGSLYSLASLLQDQKQLSEAEPLFRESLELLRQVLPAGHPHIALILNNLASLLRDQGKLNRAELLFRESLKINRQAFPTGHPHTVTIMLNLAMLLQDQGKLDESEPLFREALDISNHVLGNKQRLTRIVRRALAIGSARNIAIYGCFGVLALIAGAGILWLAWYLWQWLCY